MLASCMEYAKPKALLDFAEQTLSTLLKKVLPELFPDPATSGVLSQKVLPDHYYSFRHRRVYAKVRKMGYFVEEAQRLYGQILADELRLYQMCDDLEGMGDDKDFDYSCIKLDSVIDAS